MNRGDARLLLAIVATASATAVLSTIVSRMVETRYVRVDGMRRGVENLELRTAEVEQRPSATPASPPSSSVSAPGPCDRVSCVLARNESKCCAHVVNGQPVHAHAPLDTLDRQMISDGIARVRRQALDCGDRSTARGMVKVHVTVNPDGFTTGVALEVSPVPALGACVVRVLQTARFERTRYGGSFAYPFVF